MREHLRGALYGVPRKVFSDAEMWEKVFDSYGNQLMQESLFKGVAASISTVIVEMFGGAATLATVLFLLLCCDYILGFCRAWSCHTINSRRAREGLMKMVFYAITIFVAAAAEHAARTVGAPLPIRDFILAYLCINEALSCFNHLAFFGVPVPSRIRERLHQYRDKIMGEHDDKN